MIIAADVCRVRYQRDGLTGLEEELRMELLRISERNLGRDNRMVGLRWDRLSLLELWTIRSRN